MQIIAVYGNNKNFKKPSFKIDYPGPILYLLAETSLIRSNRPFFFPDFCNNIYAETDLVLKICKVGKNIPQKFAHRYYDEIGFGVRFIAMDIFNHALENGMPWTLSRSFEGSVAISSFINFCKENIKEQIAYSFMLNDKTVNKCSSLELNYSFNRLVSEISKYFTLRIGDLIFTGSSAEAIEINISDRIAVCYDGRKMLDFQIK